MNVETETLILKTIEKLDQKLDKFIETTNHKLDKFIETTNQKFDEVNTSLTIIQVNQARLEGEVKTLDVKIENLQKGLEGEIKTLDVKIENLQKGQDEFKAETKENFKEVNSELKDTRNDVSSLYKWVIGLILTLGIGTITLGIGVATIIFRVFDLFPKA